MLGAWLAIRGVRRTYERLNRRDLDRFLDAWAKDATFEFPGDTPAGLRNTNSGVTAIALRAGRVQAATDDIFDTGPRFRSVWGVDEAPREGTR